jgi:hypothetical protein
MTGSRRLTRQLVLVALCVGGLYFSGRGHLADPPWRHPSSFTDWWEREGSIVAAFSAARVTLMGAGAYWFGLLVTVWASSWLGAKRMLVVLSRSRILGATKALRLAVGASAMGSVLVVAASPSLASPVLGPDPAPVLTNLSAASAGSPQPVLGGVGPVLDPAKSRAGAAPTPPAPARPAPIRSDRPGPQAKRQPEESTAGGLDDGPDRPGGSSAGTLEREWVVRPGDDLWSIAARTLEAAWRKTPSDPQIARYWQRLIESNRARLPDPADPSLLFPADVIFLPPVPSS